MTTVKDIYDRIDELAPFDSAMDFDNVGILVGAPGQEVRRVMTALDICRGTLEEARSKNVDLIISHHPVIFHPLTELHSDDIPYLLAKTGISALCCHTNLDLSPHIGVNVALGRKLGLTHIRGEKEYGEGYVIYSGILPQALSPEQFAAHVKEKLQISAVKACLGETEISKVCFTSGAGGEFISQAEQFGADAFVTGEIKHHEELQAASTGITAVAAGHFETERMFADLLVPYLRKCFPDVGFIPAAGEKPAFQYI